MASQSISGWSLYWAAKIRAGLGQGQLLSTLKHNSWAQIGLLVQVKDQAQVKQVFFQGFPRPSKAFLGSNSPEYCLNKKIVEDCPERTKAGTATAS